MAVRLRGFLGTVAVVLCGPALAAVGSSLVPVPDAMAIGSSDTVGPIYTTAQGMTLYSNSMDQPDKGAFGCSDTRHERTPGEEGYPIPGAAFRKTCLERWHPFAAGAQATALGAFGFVERPNGVRQWTLDGTPLYTSTRDLAPGDVNGTLGFGSYGRWRTVPVELWFPPGIGLVRRVQGLLLGTQDDGLLFAPGPGVEEADVDWLPLSAPELARPRDDFQIVRRADGGNQWVFRGERLYRPRAHVPAHRIQRIVEAGRWRPVIYQPARPRPGFVTLHMSVPEMGWVFGDADGRTLYLFYCFDRGADGLHCDEPGDAAAHRSAVCGTGEQCAREWRPVAAGASDEPDGNWGIADVPHPPFMQATGASGEGVPRVRAWTYHGRPVYTFAGDRVPGDVLGHGIEARSSGFGAITVLGDEFPLLP